tara:strand:+ start:203 stop:439 length:237 start_codon:yes stop_codon:yes gene_type:complete
LKLKKIGLNLKKTKKTLLLEFISESISKENNLSPLSDEALKKMFEQKNKIKVSRKTISKYRILLNLPAAHNRKQENGV